MESILEAGGSVRFDFEVDDQGCHHPSLDDSTWWKLLTGTDLGAYVVEAEAHNDQALESIESLPLLRRLKLCSQKITDAGLEHLEKMGQLEELTLEGTAVTDEGIRKLQKALPHCRIVRH